MSSVQRLAAYSGPVGGAIGLIATLLAVALSPTFTWTGSALSELGGPTAANPWLFNWGLIVSGIVALPFAWAVWAAAENATQRTGAGTFALCVIALALVGVYPIDTDLHGPTALAYFAFLAATLWIHGSGTVLAGRPRAGLVAIWFGIVDVLTWIVWYLVGPGTAAVPELVGAGLLLAWIVLTARSFEFVALGPLSGAAPGG